MRSIQLLRRFRASYFALLLLASALSASAQTAPPSFSVRFIGTGTVAALNNVGTLVGSRTDPVTGVPAPLVSIGGGEWAPLPQPAGATGAFPTDLNDLGVIVGVANMSTGRRAVRWTPTSGSSYTVEVLPLLPGEVASYATGINHLGQIVGARAGILGTPYGFGWLFSDETGLVGLQARYGWFATPDDINDAQVILSGTQTFDLKTSTVMDVGLSGPTNYNAIGGVDINNQGAIAGVATLRSSSLNISSAYRFLPESGWQFISGSSKYTVATDINNRGDMGWGEQGAGIYFDGLGAFALGALLDPATAEAGWVITGNGCFVNDSRVIATVGRNTLTGQSGVVLLTPAGTLPAPAAPTGLTATPHPATGSEPYMSINLAWINGDARLTSSFELERRVSGQAAWTAVPLVPPGRSTSHQDTTVAAATRYDYRVRGIGVAGPGPWSSMATATSPATPLDTTKPTVTLLSPANGASLSGIVSVSAQATDNVAVDYLEISYWDPTLGQEVILGSVQRSGSLTASWDTRSLTPATYRLRAFAQDSLRNWNQAEATVTVTAPGKTMSVRDILLSASLSGTKVTATGQVFLKDQAGQSISNADVAVRWSRPGGSTRTGTARTDGSGRATFSTSGQRGTYVLTVTGVTKQGFVFDAAGSVLSKSITR